MNLYIVENGHLVRYRRTGECRRCGECCRRYIKFQFSVTMPAEQDESVAEDDWTRWEGFSIFLAFGAWWYAHVGEIGAEQLCPNLGSDNRCQIWDDRQERGPLCWHWPVHPDNLQPFPNCGYRFEREVQP